MKAKNLTSIAKRLLFLLVIAHFYCFSTAQVTGIYTDYNGFWKSSTTAINPILPDNSNNVLAFTYNSVTFSTGVNDNLLTTKGVTYTASNFKALPVTSIGSTVASSTYIALGTLYDGVNNGFSNPLPSERMIDVLTDGINGLNIGTGVTNIPAAAAITFPVNSIDVNSINDSKPDILFSQTAQPTGAGDKLYFVDNSGDTVGTSVSVTWTSVPVLGSYTCDLYNLSSTTCDAAVITSGALTNQIKDIRLIGLRLSEFGLTAANSVNVVSLVIKPGGQSDPAFVAYNSDAVSIPSPVINIQPHTTVTCPGSNNDATFSVTASGFGLTYQWLKDGVAIPGATSSSYTIVNVKASDAGKYEVAVSNDGGTVTSSVAYLNTTITVQPSPVSQTIATGNKVTLSVTATNATSYQWKRNDVDIEGATSSSYTINPLTTTNDGTFNVNVINSALNGCASLSSNAVNVSASVILYSKSSGNLNAASTWGVNTNGTGSTPVNFTRSEHIFKVANRSNAATGGNLTIAGTLDLMDAITTITPGTTLSAGHIIRSGTIGTLSGSATSNLTLSGNSNLYFTTGNQVLKDLTINGGTTELNTLLNITGGTAPGIVTINSGTLATLDNLTLKSDADGTSAIGTLTGTITGKVTVERYINTGTGAGQHGKAWQFLSTPTLGQTVKESWMENGDTAGSYGTMISGPGGTASGFDMYSVAPSIKYFSDITGNWKAVSNTNDLLSNSQGYMLFVRGDRSVTSTTAPANPTVLRSKGTLFTGTQLPITVKANQFQSVGNPYASPIDFSLITKDTTIDDAFYVYDPYLYGTYGVGGYQTLSSVNNWKPVPGGTSAYPTTVLSSIIQSGQAFFLHSHSDSNGVVIITEDCKSTTSRPGHSSRIAAKITGEQKQFLRASLITNTGLMADGNVVAFDKTYRNNIDGNDAVKIVNSGENFAVKREGKLFSIEAKSPLKTEDTIYYNISNLNNKPYQLAFAPENMESTGMQAFLIDKFLNKETPVSLSDSTFIEVAVTSNAASKTADRFKIVFRQMGTLPVTITSISAINKENNNFIQWTVENESGIQQYEVEKSTDGNHFSQMAIVKANNTKSGNYEATDKNVNSGTNFYRIKIVSVDGKPTYTQIVKVVNGGQQESISVYPNPIENDVIHLQLNNQPAGIYKIKLYNSAGQVLISKNIAHAEGSIEENIKCLNLPKGIYQLKIMKPDGNEHVEKFVY